MYNPRFNVSLIMITMVTTIVMVVIGSNISVSLGMVGALSIIRFRTAVKDPRDTAFIFWCVVSGLACGTQNYTIVIVGSVFICLILFLFKKLATRDNEYVLIIKGPKFDIPAVEKAINTLKDFEVPFEVHVFSAHRTPVEARDFAVCARENGFGAIIAAAGKAAHLAGAMAANTTLPVIGIPVKSSTLDGIDALLSTVQMPSGMPVATVAIDGAVNAALLSIQILAVSDEALAQRLADARAEGTRKVLEKNAAVEAKYNV